MSKYLSLSVLSIALLSTYASAQTPPPPAPPQEVAKVLSAKPITRQIQIPQQICGTTPVTVATPNSGAGAALGAVAGGALGNAVGEGAGKAAATAIGIVGGAIAGNNIEGPHTAIQNTTTCTTQLVTQNITAFDVEYIYAGKKYHVELPNDPGKTIAINVAPAIAPPPPSQPYYSTDPNGQPLGVAPPPLPAPVYVAPYPYPYYGYPYYGPYFGVGIGIGYGYRHR